MENRSSGNHKPSMQQLEANHEDVKAPAMKVKTSGLSPYSPSPPSPSSSESLVELSNRRKDSLGDVDASLSASSSSPDHVLNQTPQWSMMSASPRANPAPMKSPPMHNMGHPPGYDPNRIPASIFSSKPNNGMEWSTASNESLFSIHMGNNSFSRDQFNMMYRSGELIKPDEWSNSPYNAPEVKSNEKKNLPLNLPPVVEVATDKEVKSETKLESPPMQEKIVEAPKVVPAQNHENNIKEKKTSNVDEVQHSASALSKTDEVQHSALVLNKSEEVQHSVLPRYKSDDIPHSATSPNRSDGKVISQFEASHTSSPRLSNESGNSSSSFAFPVLLNDAGKTGSLKAPSAKMETPQPQPQPDSQPEMQPQLPQQSHPHSKPESKPKLAATTWFSCFSCWPRCC
ncbi:unnamed protein product [Withania somnifera]